MTFNVLLYGATGHSGEIIAEKAVKKFTAGRLILAGRSAGPLNKLATKLGLGYRTFGLEEPAAVVRNLVGINLVVNAAGPFALTAPALVKGCLEVGCSYVDINGEVDVYMKLDDLARQASARQIALVCSAGHTAGASCLLLNRALTELEAKDFPKKDADGKRRIGAVRIALSMLPEISRGSAVTGLRLVREQVLTIRRGERVNRDGKKKPGMVKWHEPVGRLERVFNFGRLERGQSRDRGRCRECGQRRECKCSEREDRLLASAANLTDTLVALQLLERRGWDPERIESYLQMDNLARAGYQAGAMMAPLMAMPIVRAEAKLLAQALTSENPTSRPREEQEQVVVLEIEGADRRLLYEKRLRAPSGYDFTATLVVALMNRFAQISGMPPKDRLSGWLTPTEVLYPNGDGAVIKELELFEPEAEQTRKAEPKAEPAP
jgi:hypothetical protein